MPTYVALLYSVILPAGRRLVMADLKTLAAELGHANARTHAATGNLVFEAERQAISTLEEAYEAHFAERFGKHIDFIIRDAQGHARLLAANPYPNEAAVDGARVAVRVQRDPIAPSMREALLPYCTQGERLAIVDGDLWVHFPGQQSKSRLTGTFTHKRLGVGTARNWNTIRTLGEMLG